VLSASTEEGFDYPVLEAKAEGIPTVISDIPVHREFHDGSSLLFPVGDDGSGLSRQVADLMQDQSLWRELSRKGLDLARTLSVEAQIDSIADQFNRLCAA